MHYIYVAIGIIGLDLLLRPLRNPIRNRSRRSVMGALAWVAFAGLRLALSLVALGFLLAGLASTM